MTLPVHLCPIPAEAPYLPIQNLYTLCGHQQDLDAGSFTDGLNYVTCSACLVEFDHVQELGLAEVRQTKHRGLGAWWKKGVWLGGWVNYLEFKFRDENIYSAVVVASTGSSVSHVFTVPPGHSIPTLRGTKPRRRKKCKSTKATRRLAR